jgi:hypothetical protein
MNQNQAVENKPVASGKKPTKKGKHLDSDASDTEETHSAEVPIPIPEAKKAKISDDEACYDEVPDGQVNVTASATSQPVIAAQAKVATALPLGTPKPKKYFVYLITAAMYIEELLAKNPDMTVEEAHRLCEGCVAKIGTNHILYK